MPKKGEKCGGRTRLWITAIPAIFSKITAIPSKILENTDPAIFSAKFWVQKSKRSQKFNTGDSLIDIKCASYES